VKKRLNLAYKFDSKCNKCANEFSIFLRLSEASPDDLPAVAGFGYLNSDDLKSLFHCYLLVSPLVSTVAKRLAGKTLK